MKRPYREVSVAGGNICLTRYDQTIDPSVKIVRQGQTTVSSLCIYISQDEARSLANELLALLDDDKDGTP